ncbi:oxygenase MpaB family protein [Amycolatopsis sp. DG1A-15b]|uniref:oxygenase MpaB family protein n=1 Tax=Amycolatopsis sp. DG1A-15b TaxID=3052846 RepID=UPI00255B623D|nr:oxygenase MpaB family protein [Amycolatopsis sp. DG1A-15b]WIX86661.1 oxygenase MpaB family protein [Amycolatopsis sp. DG1A-15b]
MDEPELFRQGGFRLAQRLFIEGDIRGDERQVARMREFAQVQDRLADDVVAWMAQQPKGQGRALFEDALVNRSSAAGPLKDFFDQVDAKPYWVDDERLERGAKAITRAGLLGLFPLGDMSLMGGYLASRATKSLVGTGEIEYKATRRLVETAAWWIDVTTPGALKHGGKGYASALRIRLVHAHVRAAMNRRDDWDYAAWDRPVNQVQTAGTLLLFSLVYVFGTQLLGLRYSARERGDILHLWRYIGWLMGVDDELLPASEEDAWRLLWLLAATEFIPDDDSKRLAKALIEANAAVGEGRGAVGKVLSHVSVAVHSSISRLVLGKTNADFLGLPNDPVAQAAIVAVAGVNFAAETVRRFIPGATALQERIGQAGRRGYVKRLEKIFAPDTTYAQHMRAA